MAYKTKDLIKLALKVIDKYRLFFIEDIASMMGISKQTFYDHKLDEVDDIKEAMLKTKIQTKVGLRKKWYESNNATTQLALYKLIGSEDEIKRLQMNYLDHTSNGEKITNFKVEVVNKPSEESGE